MLLHCPVFFLCTKRSVSQYLRMTDFFVFSLRIEKLWMSLYATQTWPENGGSFKDPYRLFCSWQQKEGTDHVCGGLLSECDGASVPDIIKMFFYYIFFGGGGRVASSE